MNKGQVYASRKSFIEQGIGQVMAAKRDFGSIKYARSAVTDQEYIRVSDIFGKAVTIEITGDDLELFGEQDFAFRVYHHQLACVRAAAFHVYPRRAVAERLGEFQYFVFSEPEYVGLRG